MSGMPIRRLLIANRGEIALRVARTAERLGIETVAVFSDADRLAPHVARCDQAVRLGPADAASSYLDRERLLAAAKRSGADAVHPGYGFLSENAGFAQAVVDAGLVWVGPHADAIARMGSKIEARRLAADAGVPIIPGFDASQQDAELARAADEIGYPVMIKASAGGGGKGIRIVHEPSAFADRLRDARAEAKRGFGDDAMIVERYVQRPRHVEVQVIGDRHGTVLHLGTRECSLQRRHQKVIEEAPAPWLPDGARRGLEEAAVKLASAIGYDNAGTVEFVVDDESGEFFFLEMNTRLQVEHPVTEMVTHLDLVELQLLVASGSPLPLAQAAVGWDGHAIEARLNAEDPWQQFRPQAGRVAELRVPKGVRFDAGIEWGSEIPPHYDSMVAKLIAHGPDRETARRRLVAGLEELHVVGVRTNQGFLRWLLTHEAVSAGPVTTRFLDEEPLPPAPAAGEAARIAALGWLRWEDGETGEGPWGDLGPFRVTPHRTPRVVCLESEGERFDVAVHGHAGRYAIAGEGELRVELAGDALTVEREGHVERYPFELGAARMSIVRDGASHLFRLVPREERWLGEADHDASAAGLLVAPFPGLVTSVEVAPGDEVHEGEALVVLEAMKMLHTLTAAGHGVVAEVRCEPGMSVEQGAVLVTFASEETAE